MWCGLLRLAKRWSPHIGRWWSFLPGLLYQRWRLLQEIKKHLRERLLILLYLQTTKGTCLWSALLWYRLNAISKSFCTVKGFTNRFIGTCTLMYNSDLNNFTFPWNVTTLGISELSNDLNIISIPMEEPHWVSFKHNFEHCILLITKRLELLMFTQVVRN